jgi:hypothetical protein
VTTLTLCSHRDIRLIAINQDKLGAQATLTAVYTQDGGLNLLDIVQKPVLTPQQRKEAETARQLAFGSNSSAMTTCDYDAIPTAQKWKFIAAPGGDGTIIQSEDGTSCLSSQGPGILPCTACAKGAKSHCHWDTSTGYSGESGHQGRANETTAQIKSKVDGKCLKFSAASRGGRGLYMEQCNIDPANCVIKRCFYSANLGDEEWYLSDNGQLIASFVRGNGHQIPPVMLDGSDNIDEGAIVTGDNSTFQGPFAGLGQPTSRCGKIRGAKDMGTSAMCKNTTFDGRIFVPLGEMQRRCAADPRCAGFSQDTKDGQPYFRPLSSITSITADPKWHTWTKGKPPPLPPPAPPPAPPTPKDWYDQVDVPFCLATEPSSSPPKEPAQPPPVSVPNGCGTPTLLVFAGPLSNGDIAVGLANKCTGSHTITATWKDIGAKTGTVYSVRDVIAHKDLPDASKSVSAAVGEHDISVLRLTPKTDL